MRNFGERTVNFFSRKKKNTEQSAQDLSDDIDTAVLNTKTEIDITVLQTGYFT